MPSSGARTGHCSINASHPWSFIYHCWVLSLLLKNNYIAVTTVFCCVLSSSMPSSRFLAHRTPQTSLTFKDYAGHQMGGSFPVSWRPHDLRFHWTVDALGHTLESARHVFEHCHISNLEQLGSLGNIIVRGMTGQPLTSIMESIEQPTKHRIILMVSWHWVKDCDGELETYLYKTNF